MLVHKNKEPKKKIKLGPKIFIKIGSVTAEIMVIWTNIWNLLKMVPGTFLLTAEIFLIWTIAIRTNFAWTNAPMTVGFCSICSQEPTFQISSKLDQ